MVLVKNKKVVFTLFSWASLDSRLGKIKKYDGQVNIFQIKESNGTSNCSAKECGNVQPARFASGTEVSWKLWLKRPISNFNESNLERLKKGGDHMNKRSTALCIFLWPHLFPHCFQPLKSPRCVQPQYWRRSPLLFPLQTRPPRMSYTWNNKESKQCSSHPGTGLTILWVQLAANVPFLD